MAVLVVSATKGSKACNLLFEMFHLCFENRLMEFREKVLLKLSEKGTPESEMQNGNRIQT